MLADVTRVVTGDEIVVRVGTTEIPVRVLGLDTPAPAATTECGGREALEYADRRLSGQTVTLVPDPTQPEFDDQGHRLSYVVLRSQLSYTDAALMDGIGRADTSRPLWYAPVFAQEQGRAAAARVGIWGVPCEERP
jgi:micrococcal nuclease